MKYWEVLWWMLVALTASSQGQYTLLSWRGSVYLNNSEFHLTQIGEDADALSCLTSQPGCCKAPPVGEWHYPDGRLVGRRADGEDFFRNRDTLGNVFLQRRNNARGPRGIYYCFIPDDDGVSRTLHVGLYLPEDYPTITKHPESQLEVDPGSNASFSVEAEHATSFQWYHNSNLLVENSSKYVGVRTKMLTVLNVTSRDMGGYHCTVSTAFHSVDSYSAEISLTSLPALLIHAQDALNVLPGSTVSFLVFSFDLSVEYQWQRGDGRPLPDSDIRYSGTRTGNLTIYDVRSSDAGTYVCVISNPAGSIRSSARLTLKVLPPVLITPATDALEVPLGSDVTFSVNASGHNLIYLWEFESGESLPTSDSRFAGVRSAMLTIFDVRTSDVGGYLCSVTNSGGTVTSLARLTILLRSPVIEKEAEDVVNASLGSNVTFSVTASGGILDYMWKRGVEMTLIESEDPRVSGVTSSELAIANITLEDAGVYVCLVSNSAGFATSNATLSIELDPPVLTSHPGHALNVTLGSNISLTVAASGHLLEYIWQRQDGVPLVESSRFRGVNTSVLRIYNVQLADAGVVQCVVSNSAGSVMLSTILQVVFDAPVITTFPEDALNVRLGSDVTFVIEAFGHFLDFAWERQDGQSLLLSSRFIGVSTNILIIRDVRLSDAGVYECMVSNDAGSVRSNATLKIVLEAPLIITPAKDILNVTVGSEVVFEVVATGDLLEYQWEKQVEDGKDSSLDSRFTGVQTNRLMIRGVRASDSGVYVCVVSNEAGMVSSTAVLSVVSQPSTVESITVQTSVTSAVVSWTFYNSSSDSVSLFEVQYFPALFPASSVSLTTPDSSVALAGLIPRLQYQIRVRVTSQSSWTSSEMILDEKIPPAEGFEAEVVNGSRIELSWQPVYLEGWNVSYYYVNYHSISTLDDTDSISKKLVVDGDSRHLWLGPDMLFMNPDRVHVFELRAVVTIDGLEGLGEVRGQAAIANLTLPEASILFQVMFGPVDNCVNWGNERADVIRKIFRASISKAVSSRCNCSFTEARLGKDLFSCRKSSVTAIYRGTVTGYFSQDVVDYIHDWVQSGETVLLQWFIVDVYASCPLRISSFHDGDCAVR